MFSRSHSKTHGYAKEKRAQDAQVSTLRELGLLGVDSRKKSSWGEPERPPYNPVGPKSFTSGSLYPEKSESRPRPFCAGPPSVLPRRQPADQASPE